ncbi:ribonuclease H-like domain-containing protein, partial [Tanacetum coccineum]
SNTCTGESFYPKKVVEESDSDVQNLYDEIAQLMADGGANDASLHEDKDYEINFGVFPLICVLISCYVRVLHVPSRFQYADIFTKGLPSALFEEFRTSLSVQCPPALTAGEMNHNGTSRGPVKWQRVLLKVSGEALAGDCEQNINPKVTMAIAREVTNATRLGVEVNFKFLLQYLSIH